MSFKVYRSKISYFSGKLEAYLRYKEISHEIIDSSGGKLLSDIMMEIDLFQNHLKKKHLLQLLIKFKKILIKNVKY